MPRNVTILFDETTIRPSQTVKNLGVLMDQHMLFDYHICHIKKKYMVFYSFLNP